MLTVKRRPNGIPTLFNVFEDMFNRTYADRFTDEKGSFMPSVNVSEDDMAFHLEFAVPGFDKKDFTVDVENDHIKISGKKEMSKDSKEKNYTRKEFAFASFERMFTLPENVDHERIDASYENGILNLVLPKKEVKPEINTKKIEIR
ncbi:MAG: Hsp20/alpha crystallin family protein [Chitinophagales bacterium]